MLIDVDKSLFQLKAKELDTNQDSQSIDVRGDDNDDDDDSNIEENCESSESLKLQIDPIESDFIHNFV